MTNEQLRLILDLIADKIENELLPRVEDGIFDGERQTYFEREWIGRGEKPHPLTTGYFSVNKNESNWKTIEVKGDLLSVVAVKQFADEIRRYF